MPNNLDRRSTINFNFIEDKKLGDFDSKLWSMIKYDRIRNDLLNYYKNNLSEIIETPSHSLIPNDLKKRNKTPNNCFSYAAGLTASGKGAISPLFIKEFDFQKTQQQSIKIDWLSYKDELAAFSSSTPNFMNELSLGNMLRLSDIEDKQQSHYRPSIGLIAKSNYHFIKIDIRHQLNGPEVLFSQKAGKLDISEYYTLSDYAEDYKAVFHGQYRNPVAIGLPKYLNNRSIHIDRTDSEFIRCTLKAPKPI